MDRTTKAAAAPRGAVVAVGVCLALRAALMPAGALAGPCSSEIAELSRTLGAGDAVTRVRQAARSDG